MKSDDTSPDHIGSESNKDRLWAFDDHRGSVALTNTLNDEKVLVSSRDICSQLQRDALSHPCPFYSRSGLDVRLAFASC